MRQFKPPVRPNPVGVTTVRLLGRKNNRLQVVGLDAFDGTPVLDIKPYIPYDVPVQGDWIENARIPEWVREFHEEYLEERSRDK